MDNTLIAFILLAILITLLGAWTVVGYAFLILLAIVVGLALAGKILKWLWEFAEWLKYNWNKTS